MSDTNRDKSAAGPQGLSAKFVIIQGPMKGREFQFETNFITIGRSEQASIRLPDDKSVSRIHAEIHMVGEHYVLENRSDNGTLVNDAAVEEKQLKSGDRILIGEHHLLRFTALSARTPVEARSSLRSPKMLIFGGIYLILLAGVAVFLAVSGSTSEGHLGADQIQMLLKDYGTYASGLGLPKNEQEARVKEAESFLRAGLVAERQGQHDEARKIYLQLLEFARESKNPVYQFAIVRLRSIPVKE